MILQELTAYYQVLRAKGKISLPGWSSAKVPYALQLSPQGSLTDILTLKYLPEGAKKEIPQSFSVPEQVKRSVGIISNFLCDSSSYLLGIDAKGKPERSKKCFAAAKDLHHAVLDGVESPAAKAVLAFFDTWQPETAAENSVLAPKLEEILSGVNLIFRVGSAYAQDDTAIAQAWENSRKASSSGKKTGRCLVTGRRVPIARLHPSIKGVKGAQSSGASLVSFNADAFESFGHERGDDTGQGYNAPVSEDAAFAYTTALNHLLADRKHVQHIADTTVVYWAEDASAGSQDLFGAAAFGMEDKTITQGDMKSAIDALAQGRPYNVNGLPLNPENHFYVLGLAPSAARLSVRFFLQDTFGNMLKNLQEHYNRLEIEKPSFETHPVLSLWWLLNETANQKSQDKAPPAPMSGAVLRAILTNTPYPSSLFEAVMLRIRAEQDIGWRKAAILKAYFLKNKSIYVPEEVLKVKLDEQSNYTPYVLGRLFAVLEKIQTDATPGINTTIRDRYFNSACATPAAIFPLLINLSQHHQRKLAEGSRIYYDKMITELESRIQQTLPSRMNLQEQGTFHLGYYHQKQALYTKKNKGDSDNG